MFRLGVDVSRKAARVHGKVVGMCASGTATTESVQSLNGIMPSMWSALNDGIFNAIPTAEKELAKENIYHANAMPQLS